MKTKIFTLTVLLILTVFCVSFLVASTTVTITSKGQGYYIHNAETGVDTYGCDNKNNNACSITIEQPTGTGHTGVN
jgi:hypothetical protein